LPLAHCPLPLAATFDGTHYSLSEKWNPPHKRTNDNDNDNDND